VAILFPAWLYVTEEITISFCPGCTLPNLIFRIVTSLMDLITVADTRTSVLFDGWLCTGMFQIKTEKTAVAVTKRIFFIAGIKNIIYQAVNPRSLSDLGDCDEGMPGLRPIWCSFEANSAAMQRKRAPNRTKSGVSAVDHHKSDRL